MSCRVEELVAGLLLSSSTLQISFEDDRKLARCPLDSLIRQPLNPGQGSGADQIYFIMCFLVAFCSRRKKGLVVYFPLCFC